MKNVYIYLIPNNKNNRTTSKFHNVCKSENVNININEILTKFTDINDILLACKQIDPSFKTIGGIVLGSKEQIGSVNFSNMEQTKQVDADIENLLESIENTQKELDNKYKVLIKLLTKKNTHYVK